MSGDLMSRFKSNHLFSSRSCKKPEKCEVLFTLYDFMIMCFHFMIICLLLLPPQSLSFLNREYVCVFYLQYFLLLDGNCADIRYFHLVTLSANSIIFFYYSRSILILFVIRIEGFNTSLLWNCRHVHEPFTDTSHIICIYFTFTLLILYFYFTCAFIFYCYSLMVAAWKWTKDCSSHLCNGTWCAQALYLYFTYHSVQLHTRCIYFTLSLLVR